MVFPMDLLRIAAHRLRSCYRAARKSRAYGLLHRSPSGLHQVYSLNPSITKCSLEGREAQALVCDFEGTLLRSPSLFPYFMLVAFEGGSIIRALILLLSWPFLCVLGPYAEASLSIMAFITFSGLSKMNLDIVARAVLPKLYLENLNHPAVEVLASTGRRVVLTSMPRVMVEAFLNEYLGVAEVVGAELQVAKGSYFTGLISAPAGLAVKHKALKDLFGKAKPDIGLVSPFNPHDHLFISHCKLAYVVNKEESNSRSGSTTTAAVPREGYPKPLVFHDGRLAFLPTSLATFTLFLYLPLGVALAIIRTLVGILLPYELATIVASCTGVRVRVKGPLNSTKRRESEGRKGVLYVCTHRTLLDPVMLSTALGRPVTAVTYSLSRMSELLAPIRTVRLTRDRVRDASTMDQLLREGDLVVCPEGTTCREPYLLRFSPLFAELADEIEPVGVDARVSMFYGTTASGYKWLDPFFFLMNPRPEYSVEFLGRVPREETCAGGCSSAQVANRVQAQLAHALGFEPTKLTRKDKYLMLAGNEGVVQQRQQKPQQAVSKY